LPALEIDPALTGKLKQRSLAETTVPNRHNYLLRGVLAIVGAVIIFLGINVKSFLESPMPLQISLKPKFAGCSYGAWISSAGV